MQGKILAVCQSKEKGTVKKYRLRNFRKNYGLENDAHGGKWHRQVSLLGIESINKMRRKDFEIGFGDFAENLTTENIILPELPIGTKLAVRRKCFIRNNSNGKKVSPWIVKSQEKNWGIV